MSLEASPVRLFGLPLAVVAAVAACGPPASTSPLDSDQSAAIEDSVTRLFESIPASLAENGPIAWLPYFDEGPEFFMASDGVLVFPSRDSATVFVRGLAERISTIELRWVNMRVASLGPGVAVVGAAYEETVTDTAGTAIEFGGFMTGVARHHEDGWRVQSLHWSSPVPSRE